MIILAVLLSVYLFLRFGFNFIVYVFMMVINAIRSIKKGRAYFQKLNRMTYQINIPRFNVLYAFLVVIIIKLYESDIMELIKLLK